MTTTLSPSSWQFLRRVEPFKALSTADFERLTPGAQEEHYTQGETLYSEGDVSESVWIVKEGRIRIFKLMSSGESHAVENLGPTEFFGTLCRLGTDTRTYLCTAVATTSCAVIRIPDDVFRDFYSRSPVLVAGMCSLSSQRLNTALGLSCRAQEPVKHRIARILLQLYHTHGHILPLTKREVAELAGTTVETTIRTISCFSKKGWVSSARGKILIKAPTKIKKQVDGPH